MINLVRNGAKSSPVTLMETGKQTYSILVSAVGPAVGTFGFLTETQ